MRNLAFIIATLTVLVDSRCLAQLPADRFDRVDRNRDGKVTREETAGAPWFDRLLRRLGRNRNGALERNEVSGTTLRRRTGGIGDLKMPEEPALTKHLDIRYDEIEGVDPNLLSLDLYVPKMDAQGTARPVLIMIHGGGDRMKLEVLAPAFADALTEAGSPSQAVDTVTLDHGQINSHIGTIDEPMTRLIMRLHAGEDASRLPSVLPKHSEDSSAKVRGGNKSSSKEQDLSVPVRFTRDYVPGTRDANGQFMGGTETMRLVAHDGKLFAGLSYWTDQRGEDPRPGAQILMKQGPDLPWEVSQNFPNSLRISAMESFTFTTDQRVFDPDLDDPPVLISTRTIEFAPWSDREFYTGGYDGAANNRRNHNTAWIFKGTLP